MRDLVTYLKRLLDLSMAFEPSHQFGELEIMLNVCCTEVANILLVLFVNNVVRNISKLISIFINRNPKRDVH